MKELKAVEILTNYIKNLNKMVVSLEEAPTVRMLEYEAEQALAELKELTQEKSCVWTDENDGYFDGYKTACGQIQYFGGGGISDNKYKFCPYCGGKIDYTPKG